MLTAIHHVQLAMPEGGEAQARAFYGGLLGLTEAAKPTALAKRGGVWFEQGSLRVHLGVEAAFHPARKAHPAFRVSDLAAARDLLHAAGVPTKDGEDLPGIRRLYLNDPFGNRIELVEEI